MDSNCRKKKNKNLELDQQHRRIGTGLLKEENKELASLVLDY